MEGTLPDCFSVDFGGMVDVCCVLLVRTSNFPSLRLVVVWLGLLFRHTV